MSGPPPASAGAGGGKRVRPRHGFTLVEVALALLLIALVAAIAMPAVGRLGAEAAMRGARAQLSVGVAQARALAMRYGRPSTFILDTTSLSYVVLVDTTVVELGADTVIQRALPDLAGVVTHLSADPAVLCFDARGVGRTGGACGDGLTIGLRGGGWVDTLRFTSTGRLER